MLFLTYPVGFDLKENQHMTLCCGFSFVPFFLFFFLIDANMNYVHCINAYNEDLDDDDVGLLKHVLQTFIVQNNIRCHVTCCCFCVCVFFFLGKGFLIKSNS